MILGESGNDEPSHGHNIAGCLSMADWHVANTGPATELAAVAKKFIESQFP